MVSEVKSTFYKINVHAALTPDQIWCHLQPAIEQANSLREAYKAEENEGVSLRLPFVTVRSLCIIITFELEPVGGGYTWKKNRVGFHFRKPHADNDRKITNHPQE